VADTKNILAKKLTEANLVSTFLIIGLSFGFLVRCDV